MDLTMKNDTIIRKLRLIAGFALIGSVVAGVTFGWFETTVDPRTIGASLGAVAGIIQSHIFS